MKAKQAGTLRAAVEEAIEYGINIAMESEEWRDAMNRLDECDAGVVLRDIHGKRITEAKHNQLLDFVHQLEGERQELQLKIDSLKAEIEAWELHCQQLEADLLKTRETLAAVTTAPLKKSAPKKPQAKENKPYKQAPRKKAEPVSFEVNEKAALEAALNEFDIERERRSKQVSMVALGVLDDGQWIEEGELVRAIDDCFVPAAQSVQIWVTRRYEAAGVGKP